MDEKAPKKINKRLLAVNEYGSRIGETHHNAKLSDEQVEMMRDLYEEGFIGYRSLAALFGVSRSAVKDICKYRKRAHTVDRYKPAYFDELGKRVKPPSSRDLANGIPGGLFDHNFNKKIIP